MHKTSGRKLMRRKRRRAFVGTQLTHLERIFETHPWLTLSCLEMSHGLTPLCASSTIRCRTMSGSGRPLTNTPPSWLTPPWPAISIEESTHTSEPIRLRAQYEYHAQLGLWTLRCNMHQERDRRRPSWHRQTPEDPHQQHPTSSCSPASSDLFDVIISSQLRTL